MFQLRLVFLPDLLDFWCYHIRTIRLLLVLGVIILMIIFSGIERGRFGHLGYNFLAKTIGGFLL